MQIQPQFSWCYTGKGCCFNIAENTVIPVLIYLFIYFS